MTGQIGLGSLRDCGLGYRMRYGHVDELCHLTEPTVAGPFVNLSWTPIIRKSPTDNTCLQWSSDNSCVFCSWKGTTHNYEGTAGYSVAPGSYRHDLMADPSVAGGTPIDFTFEFKWTPSANINDIRQCELGRGWASFSLQPGQSGSVTLIVPDLGQTTQLEKDSGDGQKTLQGGTLANPLGVKASGVNSSGSVTLKGGLPIAWTVTDPAGVVVSQFSSVTDAQTGISAVAVTLGSTPGDYTITALCAACAANQQVTFTATALTEQQATALVPIFCGGTYAAGQSDTFIVEARNTVSSRGVAGFGVNYNIIQTPGGGSLNQTAATTGSDGQSQSSLTLGPAPGGYLVQVDCPDCLANPTLTCSVTAILPPKVNQKNPSSGLQTAGSSQNLSVVVSNNVVVPVDQRGTPIGALTNTTNVTVTAPSTLSWSAIVVPVDKSGGHKNHIATRPAGSPPFIGMLSPTSGTGNASFTFSSGQVGEQEKIVVTSSDGSEQSDVFINVKVAPDLVPFPKSGPNHVVVRTQPDQLHPDANYVNSTMMSALLNIAKAFRSSFGAKISFNDMSLPTGGIFDIYGQWDPSLSTPTGHFTHRKGTSADVNSQYEIAGGRSLKLTSDLLNQLLHDLNSGGQIQCCRIKEEKLHVECPPLAAGTGGNCDPASQ